MHTFNKKNTIMLTFFTTLLIIFNSMVITAQEKFEVGGKMSTTVTAKYEFAVGDIEGHIFQISKSEGVNTSTGKNSMMDGALIINNNFSDIINGNGHHQGYIIFSKEGNITEAKWEGEVTTTMSGNIPNTKFKGKFTYTSGTGKFKNIQGGGTYKGEYISANTYLVDWEGEYSLKK